MSKHDTDWQPSGAQAVPAPADMYGEQAQPAEAEGADVVAWLLEGGRFYRPSVVTTEAEADRRIAERKDETVKSPLVRQSAITAVTAERDALRKDAERYRWLRENNAAYDWELFGREDHELGDDEIDAALAAKEAIQ